MDDTRETPQVGCGNERHPDGPWHPATPLPFYGGRPFTRQRRLNKRAERRYEANKASWGCGCDSWGVTKLHEAVRLLEQVHGANGNWTTPSWWVRQRDRFLSDLHKAKTHA
jgi:hypothetical protein